MKKNNLILDLNIFLNEEKHSLFPYEYLLLNLLLLKKYEEALKLIKLKENEENWLKSIGISVLIDKDYIRKIGNDTIKNIYVLPKSKELFPKEAIRSKEITEILTYFFIDIKGLSIPKALNSIKAVGNRKFASGRLQEGYSVEEIKQVFDFKHPSKDSNMRDSPQYYRIETLLNPTKFQSYYTNMETKSTTLPETKMI